MEPVEIIEHNGKTIELHYDQDAQSPRENDNLGTILYCSTKYTLGDKCLSREEIKAIESRDDIIMLPVYAYIHSGTVLNTTGFSCPWDSGQCGIIYVEKDKIRKEWGVKKISKQLREKVLNNLRGEVEEYSNYLSGQVYGYVIKDAAGNETDSCWGYIGYEWAVQAAKEAC
jgi:hypothetical protein